MADTKTIYVYRDDLRSYQEFPIPVNRARFYAVEVPIDFDIEGLKYNPSTRTFEQIEDVMDDA